MGWGKHVTIERELLALEVAASTMTASNPTNRSLGNNFSGDIVEAVPFEMDKLTPEHHDGPTHRDARL
jgi:hypothetical protein